MQGMESYSKAATEPAMKVQEVILRALAKKITWWQAAEIIGISDRAMRRWRVPIRVAGLWLCSRRSSQVEEMAGWPTLLVSLLHRAFH
jgi:hypothetical protein